jgi:hypothetical protein
VRHELASFTVERGESLDFTVHAAVRFLLRPALYGTAI